MLRDPTAARLAWILVTILSVLALYALGRRHAIALPAILAFVLHALRGVQVQFSGELGDGAQYHEFAMQLSQYWSGQAADPGIWLGKDGFPAVLAAIYTVIGPVPEVGYVLNALAGGLAVLVVASATSQLGWHRAVKPSAWIVALWPVAAVYGGMLLREAFVTLLLAIGMWGTVRIYNSKYASGLATILAAGVAMVFMRGGLAFLILVGMPLTTVVVMNLRGKSSVGRWAFAVVVFAMALVSLRFLSDYFETTRYFEYRVEVVDALNVGTSSFGQAGVGGRALDTSFAGQLERLPLVAVGPLPWQVRNIGLAIAGADAVLWIVVWMVSIYGMWKLRPRALGLLFIAPTLSLLIALAANSTNFGLIIRLRGQGIVLIAPLAAFGLVVLADKVQARRLARERRLRAAREAIPRRHARSAGAARRQLTR